MCVRATLAWKSDVTLWSSWITPESDRSTAAKRHFGPINTLEKAYVNAHLTNEIIVSSEIIGFENQVTVFIKKKGGPV